MRDGGVLKVDSFLNHQMDVGFFVEMAKEIQNSGSVEDKLKLKNIYEETLGKLNGKSVFINCIKEKGFKI